MDRILGLAVSWARHIGWAAATLAVTATVAWADRPRVWQLGMQESVTPTHDRLDSLHDLLLVIITLITVFELARSEEHTSELQSLMSNSYAVFSLTKKYAT